MKYLDGKNITVGDRVDIGGGMTGVVVCSLDDGTCADDFPIEDWAYLEVGILVMSDQAGIVHFSTPGIDLSFTSNAR